MTHFKVEIQLPLEFNLEEGKEEREKVPDILFLNTYSELYKLMGGVNTNNTPIIGSWKCPETNKRYDDKNVTFVVLVPSEGQVNAKDVTKIQELIEYKEKLMKRFKQESIFMIAIRCTWL